MHLTDQFARLFKRLLPSPFAIAVILSVVTYLLALLFTDTGGNNVTEEQDPYWIELLFFWKDGLWNGGLMIFAMQMMLILVLGHTLALSKPVSKFIDRFLGACNTTAKAASIVAFFTILVGLFNWGLALIFGAVFARKVAEYAQRNQIRINYPVVGAAGYTGLLVWHGGFSGSSLIKVAEPGHLKSLVSDKLDSAMLAKVPESITFQETVFGNMNIVVSLAFLILVPAVLYIIGQNTKPEPLNLKISYKESEQEIIEGAEQIDHSKWSGILFGAIVLLTAILILFNLDNPFNFFTPNNINLLLLGLALVMHQSFHNFTKAVGDAISGAAGILIQFPLYFGIMGIMKDSGMVADISQFIANNAGPESYPFFTFISAGLVNVFVPSGGGQWAIQGPIIIQAALDLDITFTKGIMAMAYGDQLTNMLQPFWALPLLGITGLKAKQILPFTLILMVVGFVICSAAIFIF
ncbi:MAG: TIGR00366 family protein [Salibacter sp.]|uniref:short-chain fatty acid transporter n=1 Tax=Salibacter sp. TaxID=2010995 RepID=UPI0028703F5F|nr:TIGR00366 family protein [Salibacter sp.]MDR9397833.1 TIGR00366 family protein [Salibacter sp.]